MTKELIEQLAISNGITVTYDDYAGLTNIVSLKRLTKLIEAYQSQSEQQEVVANLWEALGKWSAYLASNGEQANLAPPSWLIDAVSSATSLPKQATPTVEQEHCCPECGCHFVGEFPFEYHTKQSIPDGWKPIETAPKDGTRLLLVIDHGDYGDRVWTGLWADGWVVSYGKPNNEPTHWMPLPAAPTTSLTSETNTEVGE